MSHAEAGAVNGCRGCAVQEPRHKKLLSFFASSPGFTQEVQLIDFKIGQVCLMRCLIPLITDGSGGRQSRERIGIGQCRLSSPQGLAAAAVPAASSSLATTSLAAAATLTALSLTALSLSAAAPLSASEGINSAGLLATLLELVGRVVL